MRRRRTRCTPTAMSRSSCRRAAWTACAGPDSSGPTEGDGGLVLVNPNTPTPEEASPGVPPEVLAAGITGPLALRIVSVLEQSVNPSIASHGGRADLLALDADEGIAYLRLSGGCQGCAMSQMTLKQGIETTLLEEVPELKRVIDVTDHGGGENPFYS